MRTASNFVNLREARAATIIGEALRHFIASHQTSDDPMAVALVEEATVIWLTHKLNHADLTVDLHLE